jgi:uncharacterized cupredoxin-like copper-binding protein
MDSRASALVSLAAVALALGGCGEQRDGVALTVPALLDEQTTAPGSASAASEVSLTEYRLSPSNPRLARAGSIAFTATNDGQVRHALRVDGPADQVTSDILAPGERGTIVVKLPPGTYKWYCPIADHEQRGMLGRVRVAE